MSTVLQDRYLNNSAKPLKNPVEKNRMYGYLKVLGPTDQRNKNGQIVWECLCTACNRTTYQSTEMLARNVSCGCVKDWHRKHIYLTLHHVEGTTIEAILRGPRRDNKSGYPGVFQKKNGKWRAKIGFKGVIYHIGTFDTFEAAVAARKDAEKELWQPLLAKYALKESGNN